LNRGGKYQEALDLLNKALEVDPNHVHALNNKGWALLELDKTEEALIWFDKALEVDQKYVHALNNKGRILSLLGQYDEANSYFDKALEIDPNYEFAKKNKEVTKYGPILGVLDDWGDVIFEVGLVGVIFGISWLINRLRKKNQQKKIKARTELAKGEEKMSPI